LQHPDDAAEFPHATWADAQPIVFVGPVHVHIPEPPRGTFADAQAGAKIFTPPSLVWLLEIVTESHPSSASDTQGKAKQAANAKAKRISRPLPWNKILSISSFRRISAPCDNPGERADYTRLGHLRKGQFLPARRLGAPGILFSPARVGVSTEFFRKRLLPAVRDSLLFLYPARHGHLWTAAPNESTPLVGTADMTRIPTFLREGLPNRPAKDTP
jgi:hypothetical protein